MSAIINNFSSLLGTAMPIVGMTAIQVLAKKVIFDPSDSQGK